MLEGRPGENNRNILWDTFGAEICTGNGSVLWELLLCIKRERFKKKKRERRKEISVCHTVVCGIGCGRTVGYYFCDRFRTCGVFGDNKSGDCVYLEYYGDFGITTDVFRSGKTGKTVYLFEIWNCSGINFYGNKAVCRAV